MSFTDSNHFKISLSFSYWNITAQLQQFSSRTSINSVVTWPWQELRQKTF